MSRDSKTTYHVLRVKRTMDGAYLPTKANIDDAGYDVYTPTDFFIRPNDRTCIDIGIAVEPPSGCYVRVAPRSGLSFKSHCHVGGGVVDPGYRGSIKVLLFNFSKRTIIKRRGDRIAQLILEKYVQHTVLTEETGELSASHRGSRGFGSSGK